MNSFATGTESGTPEARAQSRTSAQRMTRLSDVAASLMSWRKRSVAGSMDLAKAALFRISVGAGW